MSALPIVLAALLASAASARAAEAAGPVIAAKVAVALPTGDVARSGPPLEDVVERTLPLALDLGYRLGPRVWGVLQMALSPGEAAQGACTASCSAWDVRFAVAIQLRLAPGRRIDPWLGLGVGVEALEVEGADAASAPVDRTWTGFELPILEAGLDLAAGGRLSVGPYASYALGEFTGASSAPPGGGTASARVSGRARHGWLAGGLKATLRL